MMWRLGVIGLLVVLASHVAFGGDLPPPTPRRDRPVADELYLRKIHQEWNNDVVTSTNPNGTIRA